MQSPHLSTNKKPRHRVAWELLQILVSAAEFGVVFDSAVSKTSVAERELGKESAPNNRQYPPKLKSVLVARFLVLLIAYPVALPELKNFYQFDV